MYKDCGAPYLSDSSNAHETSISFMNCKTKISTNIECLSQKKIIDCNYTLDYEKTMIALHKSAFFHEIFDPLESECKYFISPKDLDSCSYSIQIDHHTISPQIIFTILIGIIALPIVYYSNGVFIEENIINLVEEFVPDISIIEIKLEALGDIAAAAA